MNGVSETRKCDHVTGRSARDVTEPLTAQADNLLAIGQRIFPHYRREQAADPLSFVRFVCHVSHLLRRFPGGHSRRREAYHQSEG